jgi:hypothetical protein
MAKNNTKLAGGMVSDASLTMKERYQILYRQFMASLRLYNHSITATLKSTIFLIHQFTASLFRTVRVGQPRLRRERPTLRAAFLKYPRRVLSNSRIHAPRKFEIPLDSYSINKASDSPH